VERLTAQPCCVPTLKGRNLNDPTDVFAMVSTRGRGEHGNKGGHGGQGCPQ